MATLVDIAWDNSDKIIFHLQIAPQYDATSLTKTLRSIHEGRWCYVTCRTWHSTFPHSIHGVLVFQCFLHIYSKKSHSHSSPSLFSTTPLIPFFPFSFFFSFIFSSKIIIIIIIIKHHLLSSPIILHHFFNLSKSFSNNKKIKK